jgi:hypothetical protein
MSIASVIHTVQQQKSAVVVPIQSAPITQTELVLFLSLKGRLQQLQEQVTEAEENFTVIAALKAEGIEISKRGTQPGSLASLAKHRQQKTDEATASRDKCRAALLRHAPTSEREAAFASVIFDKAGIVTPTTGYQVLKELLASGDMQRIGSRSMKDPFRYFRRAK